jgi:hypothetical protein
MASSSLLRRPRIWWILSIAAIIIGLSLAAFVTREHWLHRMVYHHPLRYDLPFHPGVAKADKIVVRDGGFDCCGKIDNDKILFTVTDPVEVKQVAALLQFQSATTTNSFNESCMCCGSPGIDWYRGERRIALTAVQHGHSIRWRGFSTARILCVHIGYGDGPLTKDSADWLVGWLAEHGVTGPKKEVQQQQHRIEERTRAKQDAESANKPAAGRVGIAPRSGVGDYSPGLPEPVRSPNSIPRS